MAFDLTRFSGAAFSLRTQVVPIRRSAMLEFFDEGDIKGEGAARYAEIELRQLDGVELTKCLDAERINTDITEVLMALIGNEATEKANAIKELLGIGNKVPNETAKRIEMLSLASVEPHFDREACIRICRFFPIEFQQWTNIIQTLSGEGAILGEASDSGTSRPSESPAV